MRKSARLIGALFVASACATAPPQAPLTVPDEPVRGGTAVELLQQDWDLQTLQPTVARGAESIAALSLIYDPLVEVDASTGEPKAVLGSWKVSSDGLTYSWTLAAARWSDGQPVIAADVLTAMKAFGTTNVTTPMRNNLAEVEGFAEFQAGTSTEIAGVRSDAADPIRFTVRLKRALCPAFARIFTIRPLPTHVFGRYVAAGSGNAIDSAPENDAPPVSSGPFVLGEWRRGDRVTFLRNERYWRGAPHLDRFEIRLVPLSRFPDEISSGSVTVVTIPHGAADNVADRTIASVNARAMDLHQKVQPGYTYIGWNTKSETAPALRDRRVREALAVGLDLDSFLSVPGPGTVRSHMDTPRWSWAYPSRVPTPSYDPEQARRLFREAGFALGSDGFYAKDGVALTIQIETSTHDPNRVALLQFAADQYRRLGVRITQVAHEGGPAQSFTTLVKRMETGAPLEGWISAWNVQQDPDTAYERWHSSRIPFPNVARLASPAVDRALEAGRSGPDCTLEVRRKHYEALNRALLEEHPYVFGYSLAYPAVATASSLRGFKPGLFTDRQDIHRWWLTPEKK